jgi:hypothetical protein
MTLQMTREQKGLRFAAAVTIAFGLWTAVSALPAFSPPFRSLANLLMWPPQAIPVEYAKEARLAFAIAGGVLAAWGALAWQLAGAPFTRMPDETRSMIRRSVLLWFVIDSTASLLAGATLNLPSNLIYLALFLVPMQLGRRTDAMA